MKKYNFTCISAAIKLYWINFNETFDVNMSIRTFFCCDGQSGVFCYDSSWYSNNDCLFQVPLFLVLSRKNIHSFIAYFGCYVDQNIGKLYISELPAE